MSAPMELSAGQQQASIRSNLPKPGKAKQNKKPPTIKHVLLSPFNTTWQTLEKEVENSITEKFLLILQKFALSKEESIKKPREPMKEEDKEKKRKLKSQIVFGVNTVTKELERDNLQLVMTCKSADPPILTNHLISLSSTRNCLAICIEGLHKLLSDTVNIGSIAIGFKKFGDEKDLENQDFEEFISFVKSAVPIIPMENLKKDTTSQKVLQTLNDTQICDNLVKQEGNAPKMEEVFSKCDPEISNSNDYSRFYIYKKDEPSSEEFSNFIPIVSDDSCDGESWNINTGKRRTCSESDDAGNEYIKVNIKKMKGNESKKKKKKIKKRKLL